ncbi:response regulator transcription factor [Spirochaeta isovalerica]|uniref:DNA-binding NarL/FixJ family response regulator n=1 Tax=Spirochaeta isovalerica TaxID=150 RepID=A0A841R474_9SPIO|nr:response regulator transcription factor [Spirochaeta isovalerica]MBB6478665.1 DNA-binding NarL/FixJ family response regulator [Spirochaeta isovalerica]
MITFLIASDYNFMQDYIKSLIDLKCDMTSAACSCSYKAISRSSELLKPQFVLVDLMDDYESRLKLIRKLKKTFPSTFVIALSDSVDRNKFIEVFRAGSDGYLTKEAAFNELFRCVFTIMQGEKYLSLAVINNFLDYMIETPHLDKRRPDLITNREKEHISYIAEGLNPKEIAYKMKISKKTVDNYRNRIMNKLKLNSIADIVKYAIREQIVTI